jgi:hypothetical protein
MREFRWQWWVFAYGKVPKSSYVAGCHVLMGPKTFSIWLPLGLGLWIRVSTVIHYGQYWELANRMLSRKTNEEEKDEE